MMRAQSPFDGTWKINLKSAQMPTKPDVYLIQDGMYHCKTCVPPIDVKADGQDHAVTGHPYYDSIAVKIVDDRTLEETDKKNGKIVATSKVVVSADGKTSTFEFSDSSNSSGAPVTGKGEDVLVAKGPAGSHAASGSWRTVKLSTLSDNGLTFTYKVDGNTLNMSAPTGQSYSAKLDGTEAPYNGDPGTSSVAVKSIGKNVIEETDKRGGRVISVQRSTVSADGKVMSITVTDKLRGTTMHFTASRQ
jgi:hypothetical protein